MSDVDYNDGEWHHWPGGECPVHQESDIEAHYSLPDGMLMRFEGKSRDKLWTGQCFFRVTWAYREPDPVVLVLREHADGKFSFKYSRHDHFGDRDEVDDVVREFMVQEVKW